MSNADAPAIEVVVAMVLNAEQQLLWIFNDPWGVFALPMTKRREGPVGVEPPPRASARAAAEVLGVPVVVGPRWALFAARDLSERQYVVKRYTYHVYPVTPHPDFAGSLHLRQPHLWLPARLALAEEYRPLSYTSRWLVARLIGAGQLPGHRRQATSTLIVQRDENGRRTFLLRWNPHWGYALPSKRRRAEDPAPAAAERVAREELGLELAADVTLTASPVPLFSTYSISKTEGPPAYGAPTEYAHALFDARLRRPDRLRSAEPLVWADDGAIQAGQLDVPQTVPGSPPARPGPVSATVGQILAELDYVPPWVDPSVFLS
jgi:hypothetical protein